MSTIDELIGKVAGAKRASETASAAAQDARIAADDARNAYEAAVHELQVAIDAAIGQAPESVAG